VTASTGSDSFPGPDLTVRTIHLDHRDPGPVQPAGQPGAVGAGAFHADQLDPAIRAQPADQPVTAGLSRLERFHAEHPTEVVNHRGNVDIGMGVNARGHQACRLYDGHRPSLPIGNRFQGVARTCREGAGNRTCSRKPGTIPHPTGECRLQAGRRIVRKTTRRRQPVQESDRPGDRTDRRHPHRGRRWTPTTSAPPQHLSAGYGAGCEAGQLVVRCVREIVSERHSRSLRAPVMD
jgi:hypothetical protein